MDASARTDATEAIACTAAAEGVAIGVLRSLHPELPVGEAEQRLFTVADLHRAVDLTHDQLEGFQRRIHSRIEESVAQIFRAHLAILRDKDLMDWIEGGIRAGRPAVAVIREAYGHHIELFSRSPMLRLREKVQDLQDIAGRLLRNLVGNGQSGGGLHGCIIVARELYPSDLLRLVAQDAAGVVLVGSGTTAHISILARSLQLPLVVCDAAAALRLVDGTAAMLDGGAGRLLIAADPTVLVASATAIAAGSAARQRLRPDTATADGFRVRLLVNVGLLGEAQMARDLGADGIGLYRSEIPFLLRDETPSEEDQVAIYSRLLGLAPGGTAVIRLLDLGGDKIAAYFPHEVGPNPSLGLRGIRFSLRHPEIFARQVRAILRAGHGHQLRILMPMVSSVDSFRGVRDMIAGCVSALGAAGIAHNPNPSLGAMIELPAAVFLAPEIAREADFLAVGSNDLVQYILAVDRGDDRVADWYVPWHPAVLRALKQVADAAAAHDRPLSLCGDIACDPVLLPVLIGMGIAAISVPPKALQRSQERIARLRHSEAVLLAKRVLACASIAEVEDALGLPPDRRRLRYVSRSGAAAATNPA